MDLFGQQSVSSAGFWNLLDHQRENRTPTDQELFSRVNAQGNANVLTSSSLLASSGDLDQFGAQAHTPPCILPERTPYHHPCNLQTYMSTMQRSNN